MDISNLKETGYDKVSLAYDTKANIEANIDNINVLEPVVATDTNQVFYKGLDGTLHPFAGVTPQEYVDLLNQKANLSGADFTGDIGINADKYFSFNKAQRGLEWRMKEINSTGQLNLSQYYNNEYASTCFNIGTDNVVDFVKPIRAEGQEIFIGKNQKLAVCEASTNQSVEYAQIVTDVPYGTVAMPTIIIRGRSLFGTTYTTPCEVKIGFYYYNNEIYNPYGIVNVPAQHELPITYLANVDGKYAILLPVGYYTGFSIDVVNNKAILDFNSGRNWKVNFITTEQARAIPVKKIVNMATTFNTENCKITRQNSAYLKFPNGLTIQWGVVSNIGGNSESNLIFPIAFTGHNTYSPNLTMHYTGNADEPVYITGRNNAGMTLRNSNPGTVNSYWLVIGY